MRGICRAALAAMVMMWPSATPLVQAEDKPKDLILGKWEPAMTQERLKAVLEFTKDGKVKFNISAENQEVNLEGTYKFTDDNTLQVNIISAGKSDSKKMKIVKVTKDELVLMEDGKKEEEKYKKVK